MANELKTLLTRRAELLHEVESENTRHADTLDNLKPLLLSVLNDIASCVEGSHYTKAAPMKRSKPKKAKEPDHDATAKRYADFEPCPTGCLCGCGEDVAEGSNFVRGHQHKLRSIAMAVQANKLTVLKMSDAGFEYAVGQGWVTRGTE